MTDTATHTPGPWTIDRYAGEPDNYAYFQAPHWGNFAQAVVRMEGDNEDCPIGLANARLIAAAPELLAALQACLAVPNKNRPDYIWDDARAAIAKATGQ